MLVSSRIISLLTALILLGAAPTPEQVLPSRLNIDLVYARSDDGAVEEHVRQWVSALQEKVQNTLAWDASLQLAAGDRIQVSLHRFLPCHLQA